MDQRGIVGNIKTIKIIILVSINYGTLLGFLSRRVYG